MTDKPTRYFVDSQVTSGQWAEQTFPPALTGLSRPITVVRARRRAQELITFKWHGDRETFCPPVWSDLATGSGPCGLGCRACYLLLTFRTLRDPHRHLLYTNIGDQVTAAAGWLADPARRPFHTLGAGIDRSDALLYEGATGLIRKLAPLFGSASSNPQDCRLILLTKSANVRWLLEIAPEHRENIIVSFSLNPQPIADLWEGRYPDGERIPPAISARLDAALAAQQAGFQVRVRLDPILPVEGWLETYVAFIGDVARLGLRFSRWTLGTYRQKNAQLDLWREKWGLPPMSWEPPAAMLAQGIHQRLADNIRLEIYTRVAAPIRRAFPDAVIGLCKETHALRKAAGLARAPCNCMV